MPSPGHETALAGARVWVTRPAHQAGSIARRLEAAGARVVRQPLIEIQPVSPGPDNPLSARLEHYAFVFFVSPNAVTAAAAHLPAGGLPKGARVGVVGQGTARALRETLGREPDLIPNGRYDSEGLLALAPLQDLSGQSVLIVRGDAGRETLAQTLRARGAQVDYAALYHRHLVAVELQSDLGSRPDIVLITSSEALRHLAALARRQAQDWVFDLDLVVVHERIRGSALELGFRGALWLSDSAEDHAVVETLTAWVQYTGSGPKEDRRD